MNILILNPPRRDNIIMVKEGRCMQRKGAWGYIMSPVTMVTLATLLRDHGHTVTVMDCPAMKESFSSMVASIQTVDPDIVYINTSTPTIDDDVAAARCIKEQNPDVTKTVLFGIHPSCMYSDLLTPESGIDYCIIGEPEYTALDLAAAISGGESLQTVAGIAFLDRSQKLIVTSPRELITNLDTLPIPDWSFVDISQYRLPMNNEQFLLVNTNRGCPYRCTFCNAYAYYGRKHRHRSVGHIMQELTHNVKRFGISNFMFWAEEFILDRRFVLDLCEAIIRSGLTIRWVCNSRVDAVDDETMTAIKEAGCWNIAFGIESGNQDILDQIDKQTSLDQIVRAVTKAKKAGLQVTGHVVIGFPHDTRDTITTTERFVNSLPLDFVQYYCAMPYPGTQLFSDAVENGWLTTSDWKQWEHNCSVMNYDRLTAAEIMKLRRHLMLRWYFTPRRIMNTLRNNVSSFSDIVSLLPKAWGFLRWM